MAVDSRELGEAAIFSPDYKYPIPEAEERLLVTELIDSNPELSASTSRFVLATVDGNSRFSNLGRSLESKLFDGRFGNKPEDLHGEYGLYEDNSTFFIMMDKEGKKVAGVMRLIENGSEGLKSVNDLPTEKTKPTTELSVSQIYDTVGISSEGILDVATIGADPEYSAKATNSDIVLASLMRAVYKYGLETGRNDLVAIIASGGSDDPPLKKLQAVNLPIDIYPQIPTFSYLGAGENEFIHIPLKNVQQSVSSLSPELYEYLFGDSEQALNGECQLSFLRQ